MPTRLTWNGNLLAQRQADAAYARLKPKPTKARRKRLAKQLRRIERVGRKSKQKRRKVESTPLPEPLALPDLDAEFQSLVRSF